VERDDHVSIDTVDLRSENVVEKLGDAFARTGFVQLIGHGLDVDVRQQYRNVCDSFFDLPTETKQQFVHPDPAANRGYRSRGSEALQYSLGEESPPDLFESFNASPDPHGDEHPLMQPTPWPDDVVADFSASTLSMANEFAQLAGRLDTMIAELTGWLDLPARSGSGPDTIVGINYRPDPDGNEAVLKGQQRMGAHSDYTSFTVLDADPVRGLQIVGPNNDWIDVVPEADGLLVNVGDLLAIATNDQWPSTLHRVVPMARGAAPNRRSVAFFHYPNIDVVVEPLDGFIGDEEPHYTAVRVEDHLLDKFVSTKVHKPSSTVTTTAGRLEPNN